MIKNGFRILLFALVCSLYINVNAAMTAEEVKKAVQDNEENYVPGSTLNNDDFYVFTEFDWFEKYDNHILNYIFVEYEGDGGVFFFRVDEDDVDQVEENGETYTYRGIGCDDNLE